MKKLFLLLTLVGMIFTACESGGSVEEENGGNAPTLKIELSKQTVDVDFETGTYSISVTSPYSWRDSSDNDWIIVNSKTGIAGTKELKFSVKRNEEEEIREGTIVIKNEDYNLIAELYVVQKSFTPSIVIEPEALSFTVEGGEQNITVTVNFEYEISTSADWVSYKKTEKGATITVPNYTEVEERTAEITISSEKYNLSKTVKVTQSAFEPKIDITPTEINFTADGNSQNIAIIANFEYEVNTSAEWLSCTKNDNGITIAVPIYVGIGERTSVVTVSSKKYNVSKTIKVTQTGLSEEEYAKYCIVYTSSDGKVVNPYKTDVFGANIVSNTYENGKGIIKFDAPVTSIGDYAFYGCSSLKSITVPNGVTWIGEWAFIGCSSLTSVTIPNSVTWIGYSAFDNRSSLTSVHISDLSAWCKIDFISHGSNPLYNSKANLYLNGELVTQLTISSDITEIKSWAFYNCQSLRSVTIPDSVTSIGNYAFEGCSSLTSVTIPNSVTIIGNSAFCECDSLTSITIPNSVTSIGNSAFFYCSSLTSVTIHDGVTSIGYAAFADCSSLTSITIPNSVTSIGEDAFSDCSSLTSVYCKPTTPPAGGYEMFYRNASGRKIYVPRASVNAYKSRSNWSDYASDIVGYDF